MSLNYYECDKGWYPLIEQYKEKILRVEPLTQFLQIKEKFGELRIYCGFPVEAKNGDIVNILCVEAERVSRRTCEVCGHRYMGWEPNRVKTRRGSWIKTLCTKHALELGYEVEETEKEKYEKSLCKSSKEDIPTENTK